MTGYKYAVAYIQSLMSEGVMWPAGTCVNNIYINIDSVSQNLCHKLFLGIPHPQISKNVPLNMGPKVKRFQDIDCCVEIREML
jgi:hypothetical protein